MDKKIILGLIAIVFVFGLAYGAYSIVGSDNSQNNTTANISLQNNSSTTTNNTTTEKKLNSSEDKKSTNKYYCPQCDAYHPKPVEQYHRYGRCPICGKYVDTQKVSHTHDGSPGYEEEPR